MRLRNLIQKLKGKPKKESDHMIIKLFEVRDWGTFIPVMAIKFGFTVRVRTLLACARCGYGTSKYRNLGKDHS
jgi:hypothetical protein